MILSDSIRKEEEKYLKETYQELSETQIRLDDWLSNTKSDGQNVMKHITEDIKLNVDGISDKLDSFSQIEMKNREIDQINMKIRTGELTLDKVNRLLESPYFGKITIDFLDGEPVENFYIGMNGFANQDHENLIYDWRSPISELFYNNEIGPSSYVVRGNTIDTSIEARRQFVIEKDKLITVFDTMISIQDDVLLEALAADDTSRMKDITATIQKEQNVIIRDLANSYILVNGVAGSGKTSAIMQRIAYLLYTLQDQITSDNVLILSPNRSFIEYVSDVLPSLGEKNPRNMTILQFVEGYLNRRIESEEAYFKRISVGEVTKQTEILRQQPFINFIKSSIYNEFNPNKLFKDITHRGNVIIKKEKIIEYFNETPKESAHADRIQGVRERLSSYWERYLLSQSKSKRLQDEVTSLTEEQQEHYFGHMIEDDSEKQLIRYAERLLRKKYKKVTQQINRYRWLDRSVIFNQLFEMYANEKYRGEMTPPNLDEAVVLLFINHLYVEKIAMPSMRFVLVDEVQDYTPAQLMLLLTLFPKSKFTVVGDENQAIFNTNVAFNEIEAIFSSETEMIRYELLTSYRSTGAITQAFNHLATSKGMSIVSVRPEGEAVKFTNYKTNDELKKIVTAILEKIGSDSLTLLVKTEEDEIPLQDLFKDYPQVDVLSVNLAKGLEFEHIFLVDASKEQYHTKRDKKILYTAFSRAMTTLTVGYKGKITPFLEKLENTN